MFARLTCLFNENSCVMSWVASGGCTEWFAWLFVLFSSSSFELMLDDWLTQVVICYVGFFNYLQTRKIWNESTGGKKLTHDVFKHVENTFTFFMFMYVTDTELRANIFKFVFLRFGDFGFVSLFRTHSFPSHIGWLFQFTLNRKTMNKSQFVPKLKHEKLKAEYWTVNKHFVS